MNYQHLKEIVSKYSHQDLNFVYRVGRGQNEKFKGKIIKMYPRIFLVMTDSGRIKSFGYCDVLIKTLKII